MQSQQSVPARMAKQRVSSRVVVWLLVGLAVLLFIAANAHFVMVAIESQPACLEHERIGEGGEGYSASGSAC